jgi:hypothetical protein
MHYLQSTSAHTARYALAALASVLLASCTVSPDSELTKRRQPDQDASRPHSAISYADRTRVESTPSASDLSTFDSERVWSGENDWEPSVAADPVRPHVYQLTTRWIGEVSKIMLRRSITAGATWEADQPIFPSHVWQADPHIVVAGDGTVFATWLQGWNTVLSKSIDGGLTWSAPVPVLGELRWSDYPSIAVSADARDVYVAFNMSDSFVAVSHDGGATFAAPVQTNDDARYWFHAGGAVAPNGDVYFGTVSLRQSNEGASSVAVLKSSNGGTSWQTLRVDIAAELPGCEWAEGCTFGFFSPLPSVAVGADGTLMIVYNAARTAGAAQQIRMRTSIDGGSTWSEARVISGPDTETHNAFAVVAAGRAAGDFRVVWQGDRHGNTSAWNTWLRRTRDGGLSWSHPVRLSDRAAGAPYKSAAGYRFTYGDYLALSVDGRGLSHVVWGEGESWNGPGGTWYTRGQ